MDRKRKTKIYDDLRQSLTDALAYERGGRIDLRTTEILTVPRAMKPREIRRLRASLKASQTTFARFLCVSPKAVQSWEQGTRRPGRTALRLLAIAKKHPRLLLEA